MTWTVRCALILLIWSSWTNRSLITLLTHAEFKNSHHFSNYPYLSPTKTIAVAIRICEDELQLNVWQTYIQDGSCLQQKWRLNIEFAFTWLRNSYTVFYFISTGMRFGLMQVKSGLCHILSRFEVDPHRNTPVPIAHDAKAFLLTVGGELPLMFKRIQLWHYIHVHMVLYVTY